MLPTVVGLGFLGDVMQNFVLKLIFGYKYSFIIFGYHLAHVQLTFDSNATFSFNFTFESQSGKTGESFMI
jgi:hypothetical protein